MNDRTGESYTNKATINGNNIDPLNAEASVAVTRGQPLEKDAIEYDDVAQTIDWEVKYNYDEKAIDEGNAKLTDVFGKNQQLVDDSFEVLEVSINPNTGEEASTETIDESRYTMTKTDEGFELQFQDSINEPYKILYQTTVVDRVDEGFTVENEIKDEFDNIISGGQFVSQGIFTKSHDGNTNYNAKETNWRIEINRDEHVMEDVGVFDTLPNGFTPKNLEVTHGGNEWTEGNHFTFDFAEDTGKIEINFNQILTEKVVITYTTEIDFDKADLSEGSFVNNASLEWIPENETQKVTKTGTATFTPDEYTQNNGFKNGSYNPETKEITWRIGVNYNKETLKNVEVEDIIQGEQNFDINKVAVYKMELTGEEKGYSKREDVTDQFSLTDISGENDEPGFNVALRNINSPYLIEFTTDLNDMLIERSYENEALITVDNSDDIQVDATVSPDHGGEYTNKEASQNGRIVNWDIRINYTQSTVNNLSLTDTLSINQRLLSDTIEVYGTDVTESGITKNEDPLEEGRDYELETMKNESGQDQFTISFTDEIHRPYVLEYDSYILYAGEEKSISNELKFDAEQTGELETDSNIVREIDFSTISGTIYGEVGSLQVTKVDADDSDTTLEGAIFELYDETGEVLIDSATTDADGVVTFENLLHADYQLKEAEAPEGYVVGIDDTETVTVDSELSEHTVENHEIKRHVQLTKVDGTDGTELSGVKFELINADDPEVSTHTTDSEGTIFVENLEPGDYYFIETDPATHYKVNDDEHHFTIEPEQIEIDTIEVENELIPRTVQFEKVDADHTDVGLQGAEFKIQDTNGYVDRVVTSNGDGLVEIKDLRPGDYKLVETQAPYGFSINDTPIDFTIDRSEEENPEPLELGVIENSVKTTSIELTKIDSVTKERLAGAEFKLNYDSGLYSEDFNSQTQTTDEDGKVEFTDLKPGIYSIEETKAPEGYILLDEAIEVEVKIDDVHLESTLSRTIENEPLAHIEVLKVDSETNVPLSNAEFKVIDNSGNDVEGYTELTTNDEGLLDITGLPEGDYTLVETEAPLGYTIGSDNEKSFSVESGVTDTKYIAYTGNDAIENDIIKGSVELIKQDADTEKRLEGVHFTLENVSLVNEGSYVSTQHETDSDGKIFINDLRPGTYKFVETSTIEGYQKHWKDIEFEIELQNEKHEVSITVDNYELVDISVKKEWNDGDNESLRPESITVDILQNGTSLEDQSIELNEENDWYGTFEDLDAVNSNGEKYAYTVEESDVEGYQRQEISGNAEDGYTITNVTETSIDVEKIWKDENPADREPVTIHLQRNADEDYRTVTFDGNEDSQSHTFDNLPVYAPGGELYRYEVIEVDPGDNYTSERSGNNDEGYTFTNVRSEKMDIDVSKEWLDTEETANRPDSITVNLIKSKENNEIETVKSVVIRPDENGNWQHTFTDIDKFDSEGQTIEYTVEEENVPGYSTVVTPVGDDYTEFEITNVRTGTTSFSGTKTWLDDSSPDRPEEITVELKREGDDDFVQEQTVTAEENWEYSFGGLASYNDNGEAYEYYIEEQSISGYQSSYDGFDITNTRTGKINVEGTKKWLDEEETSDRPEEITVVLTREGDLEFRETQTVNAEDDRSYRFENLDQYDEQGVEYEYIIDEEPVDGYEKEVDGYDLINTRSDQTSITVSKEWLDDENATNDRPAQITVELYRSDNEDQAVDTKVIRPEDDWEHTFDQLALFDDEGQPYTYEVKELPVDGYKTTQQETPDGIQITNVREGVISIDVSKEWNDGGQVDLRPEEVEVDLYRNGDPFQSATISSDEEGQWQHTFSDLDEFDDNGVAYEYTVKEKPMDGYKQESIFGDKQNGFAITNVSTTSVDVTKEWLDDENDTERPEEVTIELHRNGEYLTEETIDDSSEWQHTFENLAVYDPTGDRYEYTVEEKGLTDHYNLSSITGNSEEGFIVSNVRVGTTEVEGTKTWNDDNEEDRPDSVTVNLLRNNAVIDTKNISAEDNWRYHFGDLDKYDEDGVIYEYKIAEEDVEGYDSDNDGFNLINTRAEQKDIVVTKGWLDDNSEERPSEVTVHLLQNGDVFETVTVKEEDGWTYTFEDLEAFDENGQAYTYTVEEEPVEGYETSIDGFNITNLRVGETSIEGAKTWLDDNNPERPDEITVQLKQNGNVIDTKQVSEETDWQYQFTGLDQFDDEGAAYDYTIDEEEVEGYTKETDQHDLTNTRSGKTDVTVTKTWLDDDSENRPESIKVYLKQNDQIVQEATITASDQWSHTFSDLDQYDNEGVEYTYSIQEEPISGYETIINGFDITNLRVGTTSVAGEKIWLDDNSDERPESISISLLQNGEVIDEQEVSAEFNWTYRFDELPEFDENGVAYDYTVEEEPVDGYESTVDGYDITNLRVGQTSVSGEKTWVDDDSEDRPEQISVNLLANGTVVDTRVVTADEDWKYQFTDLDKYDQNGVEIEYTVKEQDVPGYQSEVDGFDITNTRSEQKSIEITKSWKDDDSESRPASITVHLLQNGEVYDTVEITEADGWSYEFDQLESFDENGVAYTYAIEEEPVEGYASEVNGFDITNTRIGKHSIEVLKEWKNDDEENRPGSITVHLLQNGMVLETVELTADTDWTHEFLDLNQFDQEGRAYTYTVEEDEVEGYESAIHETDDGFEIVNTKTEDVNADDDSVKSESDDTNLPRAGERSRAIMIGIGTIFIALAVSIIVFSRRKNAQSEE